MMGCNVHLMILFVKDQVQKHTGVIQESEILVIMCVGTQYQSLGVQAINALYMALSV